MRKFNLLLFTPALAFFLAVVLAERSTLLAHCDTMGGPVIKAAQKALETGNVNLVLIWVQKQDEPEIRAAFQKTLTVRKLSPASKELADMYFFETLVRIHRAGEGAPYTSLKPEGEDLGPVVPLSDNWLKYQFIIQQKLCRAAQHVIQFSFPFILSQHFKL